MVSPISHKEFIILEKLNKENNNFIVESTGEQSETDTKTFASFKQESAIDNATISHLKTEFSTFKAEVNDKLSYAKKSNKTMCETQNILVENYKYLYKQIERLEKRLNKLENRLPDYKALEKQNTILEYRLDCLVGKLSSANDPFLSSSTNNDYPRNNQQLIYPHSYDEPPLRVYKSIHDLLRR